MLGSFRRLVAAAVLLGAVLALAGCGLVGDKSYSFPRVVIDATVNPDGSLSIEERRTFDFHGEFHFAYFTVEHKQFNDVVEFEVSEDGVPFDPDGPAEASGSAQYEDDVLEGPGGFKFKATWWFDAQDEERTFTFRYRVLCAVDLYADTAHLLWKFIGEGWTETTDRAAITVHLPGKVVGARPERPSFPCIPSVEPGTPGGPPVDPPALETVPLEERDVRTWAHGPLHGNLARPDPQTVVLAIDDLDPGTFVEGSVTFPPDAVPFLYQEAAPGLAGIVAEERALADAATALRAEAARQVERIERWRDWLTWAAIGLPVLAVLFVLIGRRRDRVPDIPDVLEQPPEPDLHPARLAALWATYRRKSVQNAFRAELLHLVDEGVVEAVPIGTVSDPEDLDLHARAVPDDELDRDFFVFLFGEDREGSIRLKALKPDRKRARKLRDWWNTITNSARSELLDGSGKGRVETATFGWLFLASLVGAGFLTHWARTGWAWAFPPGLLFLRIVMGRFLPIHLPMGPRERMRRWASFRRYLKDFSSLPSAPALAVIIWEKYLSYAVALDVADEVEKQVRAFVPEHQLETVRGRPMMGVPSHTFYHLVRSAPVVSATSAAAIANPYRASSSSSSSSSGFSGGGFSSGGGGGGGGTGGGAG